MALLNASALARANTGFRALFLQGLEGAKPVYTPYCIEIMSDGPSEIHLIPSGPPQMHAWKGSRQVENMKIWEYTLKNEQFEATLAVDRNDINDDKLGVYAAQFRALGARAMTHPDKLFAEVLEAGFTGEGYDGVPFFDDDHPLADGVQSNLMTDALDQDAFEAARTKLRQMKDWNGEPVDPMGLGAEMHLIVPPALESTGRELVVVERLASGASNPNYNAAKLIVNPRLTVADQWYLAAANGTIRPFIKQNRSKPELTTVDNPDDTMVFLTRKVMYGVDVRYAVGYGAYQLIIGSNPT